MLVACILSMVRGREREGGRGRERKREGVCGNCLMSSILKLCSLQIRIRKKDRFKISSSFLMRGYRGYRGYRGRTWLNR